MKRIKAKTVVADVVVPRPPAPAEPFADDPNHWSRTKLAELVETTTSGEQVQTFPANVRRFNDLVRQIKALTDEKEELRGTLATHMGLAGVKEVVAVGLLVSKIETKGRETLDRKALVVAGVTEEQLKAGTKTGAGGFRFEVEEYKPKVEGA